MKSGLSMLIAFSVASINIHAQKKLKEDHIAEYGT